jgi:hypothetical protein
MADTIILKSTEMVHGHISGFVSADDPPRPATVDGPPIWSLSNATTATLIVSADGMDVDVIALDMAEDAPPATAVLTMSADANKSPVVADFITKTWDFVVTAPAGPVAASANVTFGTPVPKAP